MKYNRLRGVKMRRYEGYALRAPYYSHEFQNGMDIKLIQNWSAYDGEWNFSEYSEFELIVDIHEAEDLTQIHKKLTNDPLLRATLLKEESY